MALSATVFSPGTTATGLPRFLVPVVMGVYSTLILLVLSKAEGTGALHS